MAKSAARDDADHPLFHVAPPVGRLNDPNGLIVDAGTYHVFFQFTPTHPRKLVYWGHATSKDLANWDYHAPAILPDHRYDRDGAYSGTALAVADGFELFYTGNYKDAETGQREATQCVVTSPDLISFTKPAENPLISAQPEGYTAHFRDPQVWRDAEDPSLYHMLLGAQRVDETGTILLYHSTDRREWELTGEVSFPDAGGVFDDFGFMWECPNLVRLTDEVTGRDQDVLIFCPQGIDPDIEGYENIFACVYLVGELRGTEFIGTGGAFTELDRGFEFYAPQVFARTPQDDSPVLLMGWAGNASEDDQPSLASGGWVHTLTVPRSLALRNGKLIQRPFLPGLVADEIAAKQIDGEYAIGELADSRAWRLALSVDDEKCAAWSITIAADLILRLADGVLEVDRSASRYPHGECRKVSLPEGVGREIELIHDRSVTEIYLGDGALVFTLRSFLDPAVGGVSISTDGPLMIKKMAVGRRD